jgi:predicted transposase YbfD/YdcC
VPCPKKVGTLPVDGSDEEKQTNEIGMAIPLLEECDIADCDITADALLTQRELAKYIVDRDAHYYFTVKNNQPQLRQDILLHFQQRGAPDYQEPPNLAHGRIEVRRIWTSNALNDYLNFPHVGQCFVIEREKTEIKTDKHSLEVVVGITSRTPQEA